MQELGILLTRHRNKDVRLVVALYGMRWEDLDDVQAMYDDKAAWCGGEARPLTMDHWVMLVEELKAKVTVIRPDQVRRQAI